MWDIGAGSGSVSIEATRITRLRQVVAVEKDADRYSDLVENIRRFQCSGILPVHGNASQVLPNFPDPDRVFVGGTGGDLESILEEVVKRLRPKGRVVQTIVTLDNLDSVRYFWRGKPFETSIVQLQVNRSVPIGKTIRFDALNPVFIITNSAL
jgi:precorrin-6Y C5,15-methyltransferase (decarboxylating)